MGTWDSSKAAGVTPGAVFNSLSPRVRSLLNKTRNYDGSPLSISQIFSIVGTRILDGTISKLNLKFFQNLQKGSKKLNPVEIIRGNNNTVNEVAAAALIDKQKFTLDPSKANGVMSNILPNWKTLATDIDQYLPIRIAGEEQRFYVKDDMTFVTGRDLKIQDGNYVDLTIAGEKQRLFTKSEIDHAFLLPEKTRQKCLNLLGAESGRTLEVSGPSSVEFDYSLTAPRQNYYVLSAVLSSIETVPSPVGSFLLKDSTIQYDLVDTTTAQGVRDFNEYIKYKANKRVFVLDDDDLIFDYLDSVGNLKMKQTDILFDSPKINKNIPLLTRQIPWYILVYPTNRNDYSIFNSKSVLKSISDDGECSRELRCRTILNDELNKSQTNKFIRIRTDGKDAVDVLGNSNTQARISELNPNDTVFKTGYRKRGQLEEASTFTRTRKKTGYRLLKEIITELDTNYLLGLGGSGKIVTEFDVFSRLYLREFTKLFMLENFEKIRNAVRSGVIANVKVVPPIRHADADVNYRSTLLLKRKTDAPADTFKAIKATNDNKTIVPPTVTKLSSFEPVPNPVVPTTPS